MKRLFIGVPVSDEVKLKAKELIGKLKETGADLNLVSDENLHFTLHFFGDVYEEDIKEIESKLNTLISKEKSFEISLKKLGVFPNLSRINVIWIGVEGNLLQLIEKVANLFENKETPVAHLTVARVKSAKNKDKLQMLIKEEENANFGEMRVEKVVLYESVLSVQGSVYKVVREFELKS